MGRGDKYIPLSGRLNKLYVMVEIQIANVYYNHF